MTKLEDLKVGDRVKIVAYDEIGSQEARAYWIGKEGIIKTISDRMPYPLRVKVDNSLLLFRSHEVKLIVPNVKVVFT